MTRSTALRARLLQTATVAVALAAALTMAACSSPNSPTSGDPTTGSSSSSAIPAAVQQLLQAGYSGTYKPPPTSGPKAATGKSVWVISCGQVAASCANIANGAMAAGKELGWNMTLFDGKLDPSQYSQGILQAIAANVSGVVTVAVDCAVAKSPLTQAKQAGIMTVTISGFDCNDPLQPTGDPVYSTYVRYTGASSYGESYEEWKRYNAAWLIGQTNGTAQAIESFSPGYLVAMHQNKGFEETMALCSGCKIVDKLGITAADQAGTTAQNKLQTSIIQNSGVNALQIGVSGWFGRFANAAIKAAGKDLAVSGGECDDAAIAAIKGDGPQQMCVARDFGWEAWAALDALNRQFASPGTAPVEQGLGFQIVDKAHNLPSGASWTAPIDYQAAYKAIWHAS